MESKDITHQVGAQLEDGRATAHVQRLAADIINRKAGERFRDGVVIHSEATHRVYTDLVIDVIRVLRQRSPSASRTTPGPTDAWPFVASPAQPRPVAATPLRVRLRMIHHGRVVLEGGVVTDTAVGYPKLSVGQHTIVSAFFGELANAWLPWGFFEVREGRVVSLQPDHLRVKDYDSVDAFAAALANPPPTASR